SRSNLCASLIRDRGARVRWIGATGECIALVPASVDLIISAQAFHWFDQARAIEEFHRPTPAGPAGTHLESAVARRSAEARLHRCDARGGRRPPRVAGGYVPEFGRIDRNVAPAQPG